MKGIAVLKKNYHQLIFVFIAFLLMIFVGIGSVNSITRKKLINASEEALHTVEANIKTNLREPEATLVGSAFTVRNMIVNQGASQEELYQYMYSMTEWLLENEERVSGFNGIYGVFGGEYLDGIGWEPPAGYVPQNRPWYTAAIEAKGKIAITEPYIDAHTQVGVVSLSQEVYGLNGESLGVISLDVMLTRLSEYVCSLQGGYGGYGILLDSACNIVAHPERELAGLRLQDLAGDYAGVAAELEAGADISGKTIMDIDGKRMILFFRKLYNGWYVGMLTPSDSYYSDMYRMEAILIAMGIILMFSLSFILMRLAAAKMRSDEENRSKSSFLARMSHEIRTPMNAILGMVELMMRKDLPKEAREEAAAIRQAGVNLLSIINDILDFSKIESNKMEVVCERYQFASLINDVINIIRMRVDEKAVLFTANIDSALPGVLLGNEARLRQALLNLLSNAVKYTREGSVRLNVSEESRDDQTVILTFDIADTGIGVKEDDLDKLFGDFTRFDTHRNPGVEGTGLGLAIARSLCRLMGGDIAVSSRYGEGSVFTIRLPQKIAEYAPLASVDEPAAHSVLVYEPRMPYADSVVRSLHNLGVSCQLATDRESFADALGREKYSFIFAASFLYDRTRQIIARLAPDVRVILLAEPGETSAPAGVRSISMPVYCVQIARLLNGKTGADTYSGLESAGVQFTAPSARILIIDDVETNLKVAAGLISPYKVQTDCGISGWDAVKLIQKNDYDIVFMDHMMPGMDGMETVKKIRSLDGSRFRRLPIIALTANAVSGMREIFLNNGFDDFLAKPIEVAGLNKIMNKWVPLDKRVKAEPSEWRALKAEAFDVEGLDTERGVMTSGGSVDGYRKVLALFCRDAADRLALLREMPDEGGLPMFVTQLHALKGALGSIGAAPLSGRAGALENAGINGDVSAVRSGLAAFCAELEALIRRIEAALTCGQTGDSGGENSAFDPAVLEKLKQALEQGDIGAIDDILDELMLDARGEECKSKLDAISEYVLMAEYQDAADYIGGLLRG